MFFLHRFFFTEDTLGVDSRWFSVNKYSSTDQRRCLIAARHTTQSSCYSCKCPQTMFGDSSLDKLDFKYELIYSHSACFDPTSERKCKSIFFFFLLMFPSIAWVKFGLATPASSHELSSPLQSNGCYPQKNSPDLAEHEAGIYIYIYIIFNWGVWLICQVNSYVEGRLRLVRLRPLEAAVS